MDVAEVGSVVGKVGIRWVVMVMVVRDDVDMGVCRMVVGRGVMWAGATNSACGCGDFSDVVCKVVRMDVYRLVWVGQKGTVAVRPGNLAGKRGGRRRKIFGEEESICVSCD
ncbi:hypothetical protein Tco_0951800 [Tanacetum coccineum]|uniref:Uncharacterized protein n=1 Tax=Tanacetum coccineum TaxID=301880 RepID=A0ABQ5DV76_9ASTR